MLGYSPGAMPHSKERFAEVESSEIRLPFKRPETAVMFVAFSVAIVSSVAASEVRGKAGNPTANKRRIHKRIFQTDLPHHICPLVLDMMDTKYTSFSDAAQ